MEDCGMGWMFQFSQRHPEECPSGWVVRINDGSEEVTHCQSLRQHSMIFWADIRFSSNLAQLILQFNVDTNKPTQIHVKTHTFKNNDKPKEMHAPRTHASAETTRRSREGVYNFAHNSFNNGHRVAKNSNPDWNFSLVTMVASDWFNSNYDLLTFAALGRFFCSCTASCSTCYSIEKSFFV